jgi:hypothetical protein
MIKNYEVLRETLKKSILNSNLDIGIVYFILKDVFRDVESLYFTQVNKELEESKMKQITNSSSNNETETIEM